MLHITLGRFQCPFDLWTPAHGRIFPDLFAFDTETTDIDDERPYVVPSFVVATVCNGQQGFFLTRDNVLPFFLAHQEAAFICHNAAFDLKATQALLGQHLDLYALVDNNKVWDTLILKRLHSLATDGHTARGEASLADCCKVHLGLELDKHGKDAQGQQVRTNFGQYLGLPFQAIPSEYLTYAARDTLATWHLFLEFNQLIKNLLRHSQGVFGYVDEDWLKQVIQQFGPLTHHIQLKASIVMDELRRNGIGIEQSRQEEKADKVKTLLAECKERMRQQGYLAGEEGSARALQSILGQLNRKNPDLALARTESGERWSTAEEDLADLAAEHPFFADYTTYKTAEKLLSTYLRKMGRIRLYPRFGYLLQTGRTSCGGGFNLQNLPREKEEKDAASTIRGCFVPGDGKVFIDSDFSQIELVVLGYALKRQLQLNSVLATLVNSGQDVHRLIAANLLGKQSQDVTKEERNSVKPISFGRPGGMGVDGLRRVAKNGYGLDMTTEQVEERIQAYHQLCPELDCFLQDEIDSGQVIATTLHLTPLQYSQAIGQYFNPHDPEGNQPQGWLGGMLLKVLRETLPVTRNGRVYSQDEIDFFWLKAQELAPRLKLKPDLLAKLQARQSDKQLWIAVRNWAGRRPVFTVTGRLRANTTFCSSRNTLFQGAAADGAILALWLIWRANFKLVDFVHDQVVIESPADEKVHDRVAQIEDLMKQGMQMVIPDMLVKVETVVTRSLHKNDLHPKYILNPETKEITSNGTLYTAA